MVRNGPAGRAKAAATKSRGISIKPSAKAASKKRDDAKTLQDKLDVAETPTGCKRSWKGRNTDDTIRKKVRDNFQGFAEAELTMNPQGGMNVFERLRSDLDKKKAGDSMPMGKAYYAHLRDIYRDPASAVSQLIVADEKDIIDPDLENALVCLNQSKKSTTEFHQWCQHVEEVNQLCLVAVFRQLLSMPPTKSLEHANIGISVLKLCHRLSLQNKYANEFAVAKHHLDACLCRTYTAFKTEDQSTRAWWTAHAGFGSLILPEASLEKTLNVETDWKSVAAEVHEVHDSSDIGRRLMAGAVRNLELEKVDLKVAESIKSLAAQEKLDQATVAENKKEFLKSMASVQIDAQKPYTPRKEVHIEYRGVQVAAIVTSPLDHHALAVEALLRSRAAELDLIPKLWCEDQLTVASTGSNVKTIADNLLVQVRAARHALAGALDADDASAANIETLLKSKRGFLTSVDRYSRVEQSFWSSCIGEKAAERVRALILQCLPTAEKPLKLPESVMLFSRAAESLLLAFAGPSPQVMFKSVQSWVINMNNGRVPDVDKAASCNSFVGDVKTRLALFMTDDQESVQGAALVKKRFSELEKTAAKKTAVIPYASLVGVQIFSWLLSPEERASLKNIAKRAVSDTCTAVGAGVSTSSSCGISSAASSSSAKTDGTAKKTKSDAKAMVRALFAK